MIQQEHPIINKWLSIFRKHCYQLDFLGIMLFLVALSQVIKATFKHVGEEISMRLSLVIIIPSSRGKNQAIKIFTKLCKYLGLEVQWYTESTDAGLVGTFNPLYSPERPDEPRIIHGPLDDKNVIIYPEGEGLLGKGTTHNKNIYQILQLALDEPGKVSKQLAAGTIEYDTTTSIIITSYPFQDLEDAIAHKGLLQRTLFIYFNPEFKGIFEKVYLSSIQDGSLGDLENEIALLAEEIKQTLQKTTIEHLSFDTEAYTAFLPVFRDMVYSYLEEIPIQSERKKIMESFMMRYILIFKKIAAIHAVLCQRQLVTKDDFDFARNIIDQCLTYIHDYVHQIKDTLPPADIMRIKAIVSVFSKHKFQAMTKGELRNRVRFIQLWDMGKNATDRKIEEFHQKGLLTIEIGEHNKKLIRVHPSAFRFSGS